MKRLYALSCVAALLAACSSQPPPSPSAGAAAPASATTNALAGTPMAAYGHALNKARGVQGIVDQAAAKQAAQIDAATGSSSH